MTANDGLWNYRSRSAPPSQLPPEKLGLGDAMKYAHTLKPWMARTHIP
jgi:hypothetical protein